MKKVFSILLVAASIVAISFTSAVKTEPSASFVSAVDDVIAKAEIYFYDTTNAAKTSAMLSAVGTLVNHSNYDTEVELFNNSEIQKTRLPIPACVANLLYTLKRCETYPPNFVIFCIKTQILQFAWCMGWD